MKTPTLIVRLLGLYLLVSCALGLIQLGKAQAMFSQTQAIQNAMLSDFQIYLWIGLVAGLAATIFAGPVARLLTFDSEPTKPATDLRDRFLDGK